MKINVHHEVAGELLEALGVVDDEGRVVSDALEGRFSPATQRVLSQLGWAKESDPARAHLTAAEFEALAVAVRVVLSAEFKAAPEQVRLLSQMLGRLRAALPKVEAMQDRARRQEAEDRGIDPGWPRVASREERQPDPAVVERNEARARRERLGFPVGGGRRP